MTATRPVLTKKGPAPTAPMIGAHQQWPITPSASSSSPICNAIGASPMGDMFPYKPIVEIKRPIGRGQFSDVYKAVWLNAPHHYNNNNENNVNNPTKSNQDQNQQICCLPVALKRIKIIDMRDAKARSDCLKETHLLQQLDHKNIVRYYTSFIDNNDLFIVLELADAGDLSRLIKGFRQRERHVPERTIWKYFRQLAAAVAYMHSKRVLHRDIKPANVFMTSSGCVKLGDFGLGRYFGPQTLDAHTLVGTFYYMSPERIRHDGYEFSSDVWSVGCVLYELAALTPPFVAPVMMPTNTEQHHHHHHSDRTGHYHAYDSPICDYYRRSRPLPPAPDVFTKHSVSHDHGLQALIERIESGNFEPVCGEARFSQALIDLVTRCLRIRANERPTMEQVRHLSEQCFAQHQQQGINYNNLCQ